MDFNLFQLKSSTFCETYRWILVTWGFLPRHFQPSAGLVLWEYQMSSLIWVIGHLATGGHTFKSNMPKADELTELLAFIQYKENLFKKLEKEANQPPP